MVVGVLQLTFHVPYARSLKDKRSFVRKFRDRTKARFDVSIAEVGAQDLLQKAVFGVSAVSSDAQPIERLFEEIARSAELQEEAQLVDRKTELIPLGDDLYEG